MCYDAILFYVRGEKMNAQEVCLNYRSELAEIIAMLKRGGEKEKARYLEACLKNIPQGMCSNRACLEVYSLATLSQDCDKLLMGLPAMQAFRSLQFQALKAHYRA